MAGVARDLGTAIIRLMAAFPDDRRDAKMTLMVYAEGLSGVDHAIVTRAVARSIREIRYFPSVAELRELCDTERLNIALEGTRPVVDDGPPFVAWSKEGVGLRRDGESDETMVWRIRVRHFRVFSQNNGAARRRPYWPDTWGPTPAQEGCRAPREILQEFGFALVVAKHETPSPEQAARVRALVASLEQESAAQ